MNEKIILNKVKRLCASIVVIALILVVIAYAKGMTNLGVFSCGVILAAGLVEAIANPIEEEDEGNDV